jgi:hypothetical protein
MRKVTVFAVFAFIAMSATEMRAQVRIGGLDNPHGSSILDLNANNTIESGVLGLALPRVALTATNVAAPVTNPVKGLEVYNTATDGTGATAVVPGIYYWDGTQWVAGSASDWFYFPSIPISIDPDDADGGGLFTVDLRAEYTAQFSAIAGATAASQLNFFAIYADPAVFTSVAVNNTNGTLTYKIVATPDVTERTFINIICRRQ